MTLVDSIVLHFAVIAGVKKKKSPQINNYFHSILLHDQKKDLLFIVVSVTLKICFM